MDKCTLCNKKEAEVGEKACPRCKKTCEFQNHGGSNRMYVAYISCGRYCTKCGENWFEKEKK